MKKIAHMLRSVEVLIRIITVIVCITNDKYDLRMKLNAVFVPSEYNLAEKEGLHDAASADFLCCVASNAEQAVNWVKR